jgi:hypothetical protein
MKLTPFSTTVRKGRRLREAPTTIPGTENKNKQIVIEATGMSSTSMTGQRIYRLKCGRTNAGRACDFEYGANGTDVHLRKCPKCQGGQKGEPLPEPTPTLFG